MEVEDLEELVRQHDQQQPSEEERREVRNLHARIRDELIAAQDDITGDGLQDMLEKVEQNFSRVQSPREAVKDKTKRREVRNMPTAQNGGETVTSGGLVSG